MAFRHEEARLSHHKLLQGKRLNAGFDSVFPKVVQLLHKEGFISLKVQYVDGTKIESAANKYTFVWRGSVEKYDTKLKAKTAALLSQIEQKHAIEDEELPSSDRMTAEDVARRVERIRPKVDAEKLDKEEARAIKSVETDAIPRTRKYRGAARHTGRAQLLLQDRRDTTFMCVKEDAMLNGQLKPGYNMQIST